MVTTGYHYKGEKRKRKDNERQWRAGFLPWINRQMVTIRAKDAANEPLTAAEGAIKMAHFHMTKKKEASA